MSDLFEPGQRVRCIDASGGYGASRALVKDKVYQVRSLACPFVFLVGITGGFSQTRFELVNGGVDPAAYTRSKGEAAMNQDEIKEPAQKQEPVVVTKTWFDGENVVTKNLTARDVYAAATGWEQP